MGWCSSKKQPGGVRDADRIEQDANPPTLRGSAPRRGCWNFESSVVPGPYSAVFAIKANSSVIYHWYSQSDMRLICLDSQLLQPRRLRER